jgi:DNA phosphorothioation-associated putative methyltransferase
MSALPTGLRRDIRASFGSYADGCRRADDRLFRAGDADAVDDACRRSAVGKLLPNALYVHRTALEALDPLLRADEGCARAYLGEIEGVNLLELHRHTGIGAPSPAAPRIVFRGTAKDGTRRGGDAYTLRR